MHGINKIATFSLKRFSSVKLPDLSKINLHKGTPLQSNTIMNIPDHVLHKASTQVTRVELNNQSKTMLKNIVLNIPDKTTAQNDYLISSLQKNFNIEF